MADNMLDEFDTEPKGGCDVCLPTAGVSMFDRLFGGGGAIWKPLCTPTYPCNKSSKAPPFYGPEAKPALIVTLLMGLQHMLAMIGGIITPPRLLANRGCLLGRDPELCAITPYLISSAMLASGILTIIQITRIKLCGGYFLGTGLISVMGTSFTFLPIGEAMIDGDILANFPTVPGSGVEGYGKFIGTCMVGALLEILLSFVPPGILKKLFPPIVTGTTVFCIGVALTGTGLKYWGGGVFCAQNMLSRPMEGAMNGNRFIMGPQSCQGDNGGEGFIGMHPLADDGSFAPYPPAKAPPGLIGADLPYGSTTFVGLGALVVLIFIVIECFGTAFMRNCNIIISLLLGYAIASGIELDPVCKGISGDDGSCTCGSMSPGWNDEWSSGDNEMPSDFQCLYKQQLVTGMFSYLTSSNSPVTFLWNGIATSEHFSIGFAPEYFFPILICFIISTVESIGDISITAAYSANSLVKSEEEVMSSKATMSRIQGGLLADGINSLLAALFLTPPNTTFSQNNGVIQITACASRAAGFACAGWLILLGIFVPIGAFFADIPLCVLGGMVTILFCSIMVGGIKVLSLAPKTRRSHVILVVSLGAAVGVAMMPNFLNGGGVQAFYGTMLNMNVGFWPEKSLCIEGTEVYFSDSFPKGGPFGDYFASTEIGPDAPFGMVNHTQGFHRGKYLMNPNNWVVKCDKDAGMAGFRKGVLLLLSTPYCIGFILSFFLNLILPDDLKKEEKTTVTTGVKEVETA